MEIAQRTAAGKEGGNFFGPATVQVNDAERDALAQIGQGAGRGETAWTGKLIANPQSYHPLDGRRSLADRRSTTLPNGGVPTMKIRKISAYQVDLPCTKVATSGPAASRFRFLTARSCASTPTGDHRLWRSLRWAVLPARLRHWLPCRHQEELAPHLIGADPLPTRQAHRLMDAALKGRRTSSPRSTWPAGIFWDGWQTSPSATRCSAADMATISCSTGDFAGSSEAMARGRLSRRGYRRPASKVGGDPDVDIARIHAVAAVAARRQAGGQMRIPAGSHEWPCVVRAVRDVDVYIEQPCLKL